MIRKLLVKPEYLSKYNKYPDCFRIAKIATVDLSILSKIENRRVVYLNGFYVRNKFITWLLWDGVVGGIERWRREVPPMPTEQHSTPAKIFHVDPDGVCIEKKTEKKDDTP